LSSLEGGAVAPPGDGIIVPPTSLYSGVKRDRDSTMLQTVLKTIHVPTMDFFFDRIQADQIPDFVLFFWERFDVIIRSNLFYFYDGVTRELVVKTHEAWRASLSYTVHFSDSAAGRVLKLALLQV